VCIDCMRLLKYWLSACCAALRFTFPGVPLQLRLAPFFGVAEFRAGKTPAAAANYCVLFL
jgi:hypothetical protein